MNKNSITKTMTEEYGEGLTRWIKFCIKAFTYIFGIALGIFIANLIVWAIIIITY